MHLYTALYVIFSGCFRLIARPVFKYVTPIYIKRLIRRQILCDCSLAPKRNSYTKSYLLRYKLKFFTALAQINMHFNLTVPLSNQLYK